MEDALTLWAIAHPVIATAIALAVMGALYVSLCLATRQAAASGAGKGSSKDGHGHTCPTCGGWHSA